MEIEQFQKFREVPNSWYERMTRAAPGRARPRGASMTLEKSALAFRSLLHDDSRIFTNFHGETTFPFMPGSMAVCLMIPESKVIHHHRLAQGRFGGTGTVPSVNRLYNSCRFYLQILLTSEPEINEAGRFGYDTGLIRTQCCISRPGRNKNSPLFPFP